MRSWWPATWNASRTTLPTFPRTSSFGFWEPMCVITRNQPLLLHAAWNDASSRREDRIPKNNIKVPPVNPCVLNSKDFFLNHREHRGFTGEIFPRLHHTLRYTV